MEHKVIEKFLPTYKYKQLENVMLGDKFPWYYNKSTDYKDGISMFTHNIFIDGQGVSTIYKDMENILDGLSAHIDFEEIVRIKANLYTNRNKELKMGKHKDFSDMKDYYSCVYQLNGNNGKTVIEDGDESHEISTSVGNQMLIFDGDTNHYGTTQTDEEARIVINVVVK